MDAEMRLPTRDQIRARRAALGMIVPMPVVPLERVMTKERVEEERERRAAEALRRRDEEERKAAEALAAVIERAIDAAKTSVDERPRDALFSDVAKWIIRDEARRAGVDRTDIISKRRNARVVLARHRAIYRIKKLSNWSLPRIGKLFGRMDHSSIIYAIRKIEEMVSWGAMEDPALIDVGGDNAA